MRSVSWISEMSPRSPSSLSPNSGNNNKSYLKWKDSQKTYKFDAKFICLRRQNFVSATFFNFEFLLEISNFPEIRKWHPRGQTKLWRLKKQIFHQMCAFGMNFSFSKILQVSRNVDHLQRILWCLQHSYNRFLTNTKVKIGAILKSLYITTK